MTESKEAKTKKGGITLDDGRTIKTLVDIAHMRQRVGMTLGASGATTMSWATFESAENKKYGLATIYGEAVPAMVHCFREVLENSIDEHLKGGHCTKIEVRHTGPYGFSVLDDGRGLPPELFHVFMEARTGSNFGDSDVSRGQNGIGVKAVRAVSTYFSVSSRYKRSTYTKVMTPGAHTRTLIKKHHLDPDTQNHFEQRFDVAVLPKSLEKEATEALHLDGIETVKADPHGIGEKVSTGTLVTAELNPYVFSHKASKSLKEGFLPLLPDGESELDGVPGLRADLIRAILKDASLLFPKLKISFATYENGFEDEDLSFPGGINGLVAGLGAPSFKMATKAKADGDKEFSCEAYVIAQESPVGLSFVNGSSTKGGTHVDETLNLIADEIRKESKDIKKFSKEIEVRREDVRNATTLIIDVRMTAPQFSEQTKENLRSTWVVPHIREMVQANIKKLIRNSPEIIESILAQAKARHDAKATKEAEKALKKTSKVRPLKLVDVNSKDRENATLYLAEGDSAAAGFRDARNEKTQGIFPLKGKVMNCAGIPFHTVIKDETIASLVASIGLPGPCKEKPKDVELNFGKIAFLTDADVDGAHIRTLLLTFFCEYWPWLAREGRLFMGVPPLFEVVSSGWEAEEDEEARAKKYEGWPYFAADEKELESVMKKIKAPKGESLVIHRNKGLGEMSREAWKNTLQNPKCLISLEFDADATKTISKWAEKGAEGASGRRDDLRNKINNKGGEETASEVPSE